MSLIEKALGKMRNAGSPAVVLKPASMPSEASMLPENTRRISVDRSALRAAGYLPEELEERRHADYYRQIRRPLIEKARTAGGAAEIRLILLTSALPGDGKTFTAINLALSMARDQDLSVLLVDADLPKAHISRVFGVQNEPGLADALLDESRDVESLVLRTDVRGLDILPAGKSSDAAAELISSARAAQITARIVGRNPRRVALIDSSPLLVSSEARALVQIPGQIVLVVRAGRTPNQAVLDAIAHLDKKKLQGLILNEARVRGGSDYYYTDYSSAGDASARVD